MCAYSESLVASNGFKKIYVGLLPVGHTLENNDQVFSRKAEHLKNNDAITLTGLPDE